MDVGLMLRRVPLFGALLICSARSHSNATREFLMSVGIAGLPIWISIFLIPVIDSDSSIQQRLQLEVLSGSLLLYAAAFTAPVAVLSLYTFADNRSNLRVFPHRYTFLSIIIVITVIATFIYASISLEQFNPNLNLFWIVTFLVSFIGLVCVYLVYVYRNALSEISSSSPSHTDEEFLDDWQRMRGQ